MSDAYAALRIPDYRRFLAMRLFMVLSSQIMSVSVGYFVYDLTNDPLMLGFIGLTEAIPAIGISLYAGHLADKLNRRNILVACISLLLFCSMALLVLTYSRHAMSENTLLVGVFGVIFLTGIGRGFFGARNVAFVRQLVAESILFLARVIVSHVLTESGGKTQVTNQIEMKGPLAFVFAYLIGRTMKANLPQEMLAMVKQAERRGHEEGRMAKG